MRTIRCANVIAAAILLLAGLLPAVAVGSSASATTHQHISIQMTVTDIQFPGKFWRSDELRLTVKIYAGAALARRGITYLTTNDPQEPQLCAISIRPGSGNYCNIDFPNDGRWTIIAKYASVDKWPPRFVALKRIGVAIPALTPASTTTTQPQVYAQPTTTSVIYADPLISGEYTALVGATVTVNGQGSLSPGSGVVAFFDANGVLLCEAAVGSSDFVECSGYPSSTPNPVPITADYSGTNIGVNDGIGTVYAKSSGVFN